jgi:hypothetical protein
LNLNLLQQSRKQPQKKTTRIPIITDSWKDIPLIVSASESQYFFNGRIPNRGRGPIGFDVEKIVLKPDINTNRCTNIAAEISLVSGFPDYEPFFYARIYHKPELVLSYNNSFNGLSANKLIGAPPLCSVRHQVKKLLSISQPLIIGCNVKNDFRSLKIEYENYFDLQNFFYEFNGTKT